jgi:hypothetical protein
MVEAGRGDATRREASGSAWVHEPDGGPHLGVVAPAKHGSVPVCIPVFVLASSSSRPRWDVRI